MTGVICKQFGAKWVSSEKKLLQMYRKPSPMSMHVMFSLLVVVLPKMVRCK